jgi:hypothetical protein
LKHGKILILIEPDATGVDTSGSLSLVIVPNRELLGDLGQGFRQCVQF